MEVEYRYYEPNQGLEEQQAKLYSEISGNPATGEEIKARYEREKIDPKTVRYAFDKDNKMLAYVQARDYPTVEETHLGYPWALPECPPVVQDKIFDELTAYIKDRKETLAIKVSAAIENEKAITFFKKKGLVEAERFYTYSVDLDVTETSKLEIDEAFTSRAATEDDLDLILELAKTDPNAAFSDEAQWTEYFKERVFEQAKSGETARYPILIFHEDQLVCASAPLRMEPDGRFVTGDQEKIIFRFQLTRPGFVHAWKTLATEIAKECVAAGWADVPLLANTGFSSEAPLTAVIAATQSNLELGGISFSL
ncbi:MAG: hypothetical protein ACXACI_17080 [Candidatus Hodarchaeales archaeon]|jgi:hypothetical protein